jgi:hypothetical protein
MGNVLLFLFSIPFTIYNIKSFLGGDYKIYFSIGDDNNKIYQSHSFKYKVKFVGYMILTAISLITLILSILYYIAEEFLSNNNRSVMKILDVFRVLLNF